MKLIIAGVVFTLIAAYLIQNQWQTKESWGSNKADAIEYLSFNGQSLSRVSPELRKDRDVVLAAISADSSAFQ